MDEESIKPEPERKPDDIRKGKPRVSLVLIYGSIFALLGGWAGLLGNLGHTFWIAAAILMLTASVFFALGLGLELRNHHKSKWLYNGLAYAIIGISFSMGIPVIVKEWSRTEPQPHLKLALCKPGIINEPELELTNDFLIFLSKNILSSEVRGLLIVPLNSSSSNCVLNFSAVSDSVVIVEDVIVGLYLPKELAFLAASGWLPVGQDERLFVLAYRLPSPLHPGDAQALPEITFPKVKRRQIFPIRFEFKAKDMKSFSTTFWFSYSDLTDKPRIFPLKTGRGIGSHAFLEPYTNSVLTN
jgi:hypothetical protein